MKTDVISSPLLRQFEKEYNFLYENSNVAGFSEAVAWFDENQSKPEYVWLVEALNRERKDFISSDREAAAFALALEALGH